MKKLFIISAITSSLLLAGCATNIPGSNNYTRYESGAEQTVRFGVVESVRPVVLDEGNTGVGAGTGAIIGGIAAGATIGSGWGAAASALGGALLGGYAGNAIENHTSKTQGLEITVRLSNNQIIAVTQPADQQFNAGDRVRVLTTGSRTRVTH